MLHSCHLRIFCDRGQGRKLSAGSTYDHIHLLELLCLWNSSSCGLLLLVPCCNFESFTLRSLQTLQTLQTTLSSSSPAPRFLEEVTGEWLRRFEGTGVPCGPINNIQQVFSEPQVSPHSALAHTASESGSSETHPLYFVILILLNVNQYR